MHDVIEIRIMNQKVKNLLLDIPMVRVWTLGCAGCVCWFRGAGFRSAVYSVGLSFQVPSL